MDSLDNLIKERLKERQRKIDFIKRKRSFIQNDNNGKSKGKIFYSILSAAACIGLLIITLPFIFNKTDISALNIATPSFEEYRGVKEDSISYLLSKERFDEAMPIINNLLNDISKEVEDLTKTSNKTEETNYMLQIERDYMSELMWSRIYILVKTNQKDGLENLITEYLNIQDNQIHKDEAINILKEIK